MKRWTLYTECRRQLPKQFPERIYSINRGGSLRGRGSCGIGLQRMAGGFSQIGVLPAWELTLGELWPPIPRHFQTSFLVGPRITFDSLLDSPGVTFGCLVGPLGSFEVFLASSGDSFGGLWLAWAVLGSLWHLFMRTGQQGWGL